MSAWSAVLRVARRDAARAKGRSMLVIAMVALPVLGVTAIDVAARTAQLSPADRATRTLGQADARLSDSGALRIDQYDTTGTRTYEPRPADQRVDLAAGLPSGTRSLPDATTSGLVQVPGRVAAVTLRELAYQDPLAEGIYRPAAGRAPTSPGEVAVTDDLAERLDVTVGDRLRLGADGPEQRVVGLVRDGARADTRTVLVPPRTLDRADDRVGRYLLVDLPRPATEADVRSANARGFTLDPRDPDLLRPVEQGANGLDRQVLLILVLVAGMALLEVVLLAGPAFAVGARRSQAQLALMSASGADSRDIRRTVLAGGLVLGVAAGAVGTLTGIAAGLGLLPLAERVTGEVPGPVDVRPLEILAIALLGVGTALLAAVVPARSAARQDVLAALTGRRGVARSSRGLPLVGLSAAAAGVVIALHGASRRDPVEVLVGSVLAELGLVATTPALVGLAGRLSPWLPAAPRLALRDAARNRGRTAPAVAAILAAVAGSVAVSTYVSSLDRHDQQAYRPSAPAGTAVLQTISEQERQRLPQAVTELRAALPTTGVTTLRALDSSVGYASTEAPPANRCPADALQNPTYEQYQAAAADARCRRVREGTTGSWYNLPNQLVGDQALLKLLYGSSVPSGFARLLDAGGVLVNDPGLLVDGQVTVVVEPADAVDDTSSRRVQLPAAVLPAGTAATIYSAGAAQALGLPVQPAGALVQLSRTPTDNEHDRAQDALAAIAIDNELYVERGYVSGYTIGLLALVIFSAVLTLGASGIATGLAAADGRADLATLAAVGASPGLRRRLAAFQSGVTAGLGTLLGVAAGLVPALALVRALRQPGVPFPLVLPWTNLFVTALVVPLVAALAAALLTRSRLPLIRRPG